MEGVACNKLNIPHKIHILDDFLFAAKSLDTWQTNPQRFLAFCEDVSSAYCTRKTEGPFKILTLAGIELNCLKHEARLSREKVAKSLSAIGNLLSRKKVTLKELQSLLGLLNFACSVVVPGRCGKIYGLWSYFWQAVGLW